jgi:hypothetical protein
MKETDYPCWFSKKDLHIAQALVEAGFTYCGRKEDFICFDEEFGSSYKLAKCCGWQLASAYGEIALDVVRDGAVFSKGLKNLNIDFEGELKLTRQIIKEASREWEESHASEYKQLSLF